MSQTANERLAMLLAGKRLPETERVSVKDTILVPIKDLRTVLDNESALLAACEAASVVLVCRQDRRALAPRSEGKFHACPCTTCDTARELLTVIAKARNAK